MRINFDFSDLEVFLAVKDTGSFHLAAERLNLSQPAVSRRIRKLEEALDSPLFERTTRAVKPTLAAKRLQARAEAILQDAQETAQAMRDDSVAYAHQRNAVVTVASIPTVIAGLFPAALRTFRAAGHNARLRVLDFAANEVAEAVAQGEADFGICSIPALEPGTEFEPLFDDPLVAALARDHDLAGRASLTWADLAKDALILPGRGTGNRLLIDEALARARLPLAWTYEVQRTATALELAAGGSGVALLPRSALDGAGPRAAFCRVTDPEVMRPVGLLRRSGQSDTAAAAALMQALRAAAPGRAPGSSG